MTRLRPPLGVHATLAAAWLTLLLAAVPALASDETSAPADDASKIDPSAATAIWAPHVDVLRSFHAALGDAVAGRAQVRVAFYGASHTAADLWTGHLRRRLQVMSADAGHGYLMPVRWHLGLRHQDVNASSSDDWQVHRHRQLDPVPVGDYGYGGVAVSSDKAASWIKLSTCKDNVCGRAVDRLELWLRRGPKAGCVLVRIDGAEQRHCATAARESVGFFDLSLVDGAHDVEIRPAGDGEVYLYGVVFERSRPGAIVDQVGIPGMRGDVWLHWREDRQREMLRRRDPHLVVLAYGTNAVGDDAPELDEQRRAWRKVLVRLRAAVPKASCLLIGPSDRPAAPDQDGVRAPRERQDQVIAMQRAVAAEYGCGHWDAAAAMGGTGAMQRWVALGLARSDYVHLSAEGYVILAERLLEALLVGYGAPVPPVRAK